ncbi:hypothetical protein KRP22_003610 [Phytophthora ramorum]|uniref:Uncharacterized protein n=1 Tax=Phytophthora ramorum TaxID=164328 RepID=H3HAM6_PHYRM|nr:hypothetical protein KRP23_8834 [Phytophthora ramorum]KAH7500286.1 hypothetical protein KRP22_9544 [Phytophthora ramorum]
MAAPAPGRAPTAKRRFLTDEEYEEEQLLLDLETELRQVQALKAQTQERLQQLALDQRQLEQQHRRLQRQTDRHDAGAATARMLQLQEKERERLTAAEVQREREEKEATAKAEDTARRRENAIETLEGDMEDLDAFLAQDAANF